MKKLLLIFSLSLLGNTLSFGQTLDEYWEFTNLYAAEDSSGTTHLYYAMQKTRIHNCNNGYNNNIVENRSTTHRYRNPSTKTDSIFIPTHNNVVIPDCYGGGGVFISDFHPFDGNPENALFSGGYSDGFEPYGYLQVGDHSFYLSPLFVQLLKVEANPNLGNFAFMPFNEYSVRVPLTENQDTIRVLNDNWYNWRDHNWDGYNPIDSLDGYFKGYDHILLSLSRFNDSLAFYQKKDAITRSEDLGETGELLEVPINQNSQFYYDSDSLHVYVTQKGSRSILISDNYGKSGSWNSKELPSFSNFFSIDTESPGLIFYADSTFIYRSSNFGSSFEIVQEFEKRIKGFYKKPALDIFYVLFEDELVELKGDEIKVLTNTQKKGTLDITPNNIPFGEGDEFTYRIIEGNKNVDNLTYDHEVEDFKMKVVDVSIANEKHQIVFESTTSRPFFSGLTINNSTITADSWYSRSKFTLFKNNQHLYNTWTYKGEQDSTLQYVIVKNMKPEVNLGIEDFTTPINYYIEESTDTTDVIGTNSINLEWSDTFGITLLTINTDALRYKLRGAVIDGAVYGDTTRTLIVSYESRPSKIPNQVTLAQNYPNPFNPTTEISYQLVKSSLVRLEVFDITGRKVAVLVDGERKSIGTHQVTFNAGNLSSGVYFYRLETAGQTLTQKMLLVK